MKLLQRLIYCAILALVPSASNASECTVSASSKCVMQDTRDELKDFYGMECKQFQNLYKIDKEKVKAGSYSGNKNENGFPLIAVKYHFKICNDNEEGTGAIQLDYKKTGAVVKGVKIPNLKSAGKMNPTKCRYAAQTTFMDSEQRNHPLSTMLKGSMVDSGDFCYAYDHYNTRLQYSDDCKLEAYTDCFLVDLNGEITSEPCQGRLKKLSNDEEDCKFVRVAFQWKVCNGESFKLYIKQNQSNIKIDGKKIGVVTRTIQPNRCEIFTQYRTIDTCDLTTKSLAVGVRGDGEKGKACRDYSFSTLEVEDAVPSASPSLTPSVSAKPSISPSISQMPSVSSHPSLEPSSSPSSSPTSSPTAAPSQAPTISTEPSMAPTTSPSVSPTSIPTSSPSSSPTISSAPSKAPTSRPSLSSLPSCVPSDQPSSSQIPTSEPSAFPTISPQPTHRPTETLSGAPSNTPTITLSKAPSDFPTEAASSRPSHSPTTPPSTTHAPTVPGISQSPSVATCAEDSAARFYLKRNRNTNNPIFQTCAWLSTRKNQSSICKGNIDSIDDGGTVIGPARVVCRNTCETCNDNFRRALHHKKKKVNRCQ